MWLALYNIDYQSLSTTRVLAGFIAVWAMLADTPSREPAASLYSEPKLKA